MDRIIDLIRESGSLVHPQAHPFVQDAHKRILKRLREGDIPCISADNVWEFMMQDAEEAILPGEGLVARFKKQYPWWDDHPTLMPPFPEFFVMSQVSSNTPTALRGLGIAPKPHLTFREVGVFYEATKAEKVTLDHRKNDMVAAAQSLEKQRLAYPQEYDEAEALMKRVAAKEPGLRTQGEISTAIRQLKLQHSFTVAMDMWRFIACKSSTDEEYLQQYLNSPVKYELTAWMFVLMNEQKLLAGPVAGYSMDLNAEGAVIENSVRRILITDDISKEDAVYEAIVQPSAMAISLMHCKNVKLEMKEPSSVLNSIRRSKKRPPLSRYHVLHIEPMKKMLSKTASDNHTDIKQSLHICRGHFKDYRQSGLFGKYKGVYWWEHHVRGSEDVGKVYKDYNVSEPKEGK